MKKLIITLALAISLIITTGLIVSLTGNELQIAQAMEHSYGQEQNNNQLYDLYKNHFVDNPKDYDLLLAMEQEYSESFSAQSQNEGFVYYQGSRYNYVRIRDSGKPNSESIVVVLLADGFISGRGYLPGRLGYWSGFANPFVGTYLWHARAATNSLINTHPFSEFEHLFTVYAVKTISSATGIANGPEDDITSYFGTVYNTNLPTIPELERRQRAMGIAETVAGGADNLDMVQIIANADFLWGGRAYSSPRPQPDRYNRLVGLSITTTVTGILGFWHNIFIHEFGHSFANLTDEDGASINAGNHNRANACNQNGVKWAHWIGIEGITNRQVEHGLVVPSSAFLGCLMLNANFDWFDSEFPALSFCRVCAAEITRRLAIISGESFHNGRSPRSIVPTYSPTNNLQANVAIKHNEQNRILPYAFHGNSTLHTLTIPATISSIGNFAFLGATGLRRIYNHSVTPQSLWRIPPIGFIPGMQDRQFLGINRSLITVVVPVGRRQAYIDAGWTGFNLVETSFVFSVINSTQRTASVSVNRGTHAQISSELRIPEQVWINGHYHTVTQIAANGFSGVFSIMNVNIPSTVTTIGSNAFRAGVSVSWAGNFSFLTNINNVGLAFNRNTVTGFIAPPNFNGTVNIPEGITAIGANTFAGNSSVMNVNIPSTVTSVGGSAFFNTPNLEYIGVAEANMRYLSQSGILYRVSFSSMQIVHIPQQIQGDIHIPHGVTTIHTSAFASRYAVFSIHIPPTITHIGNDAFIGMWGTIYLAYGWMRIPGRLFEGTRVQRVVIPESVTSIGQRAFAGFEGCGCCGVNIPFSVERIERDAFINSTFWNNAATGSAVYVGQWAVGVRGTIQGEYQLCCCTVGIADFAFENQQHMTGITIPFSVENIGTRAFVRTNLKQVIFERPVCSGITMPYEPLLVFHSVDVIWVPSCSVSAYMQTYYWFESRILPIDLMGAMVDIFICNNFPWLPYDSNYPQHFETIALGQRYGAIRYLPEPSLEGFMFDSWWTSPNEGGMRISNHSVVLRPYVHTLYARWLSQVVVGSSNPDIVRLYGGTMNVALESDNPIDCFWGFLSAAPACHNINTIRNLTHERLFRLDHGGWLRPRAARILTIDYELNQIVLQQTGDIRWHDGVELTLDDVVFTIELAARFYKFIHQNHPHKRIPFIETWRPFFCRYFALGYIDYNPFAVLSGDGRMLTLFANIETTTINYEPALTTPLRRLAYPIASILPRHHLQDIPIYELKTHPRIRHEILGSGAFINTGDIMPGQSIQLIANENHWQGRPHLDSIIFHVMSRPSIEVALSTGEIHVALNALSENSFNHFTNCIFALSPSSSPTTLMFNFNNTARWSGNLIHNEDFRRAISSVINVSIWNQIFPFYFAGRYFENITQFVNYFPYSFINVNFKDIFNKFNSHVFDPEYAMSLFDMMGLIDISGDGFRDDWNGEQLILRIFAIENDMNNLNWDILSVIVQNLFDIGINVEIVSGTRYCIDAMLAADLIFGNINLGSAKSWLIPFFTTCQPCCCNVCDCSIQEILYNISMPLVIVGWDWLSMAVNRSAAGMFISACAEYVDFRFAFFTDNEN